MYTQIIGSTLLNDDFKWAPIDNKDYFIKGRVALKRSETKENNPLNNLWDVYDFNNGVFSYQETIQFLEQLPR